VLFGIHHNREWATFATDVLRKPDLAGDARFAANHLRVEHRDAMDAEIARSFGQLSTAEALARLDAAQIANARINSVEQFIAHPQLTGRDGWRQVESPVGPVPALVPPVRMEGVEPVMGPIPAVGAQSAAILAELGFDDATISRWKAEQLF
jgi:itaconate CoA-transferase